MSKALVIYDGDCGICQVCVNLIGRLDWCNAFECHPLQHPAAYAQYTAVTQEACEKEVKLIVNADTIYGGADAVIRICIKLPLLAPIGWLFLLPPLTALAHWLYPKIADNRHRISARCGLGKK